MRYAVLDVGTNTVKLLVADHLDNDLQPLLEESEPTRLGQDVSRNKKLLPQAIERTVKSIEGLVRKARKFEPQQFLAYTTSAVRDSTNRDDFLRQFREAAGFECEVISGEKEAEFIFRGATSHPALRDREIIVFDIGGGSMEFIHGRGDKIEFKTSLNCGAVRMTEMFVKSDPPSKAELAALEKHVLDHIRSAATALGTTHDRIPLLGTGGTISCLASMDLGLEHPTPARIDGHSFTLDRLTQLRNALSGQTLAERKQIRGLPPSRADIIVAGSWILVSGLQFLEQTQITVSARNLRYGAILKHAAQC